jgi:hypothetical protein
MPSHKQAGHTTVLTKKTANIVKKTLAMQEPSTHAQLIATNASAANVPTPSALSARNVIIARPTDDANTQWPSVPNSAKKAQVAMRHI